jgi:hypothetical protein
MRQGFPQAPPKASMFDDTTFVEYTHTLSKIHTHTHTPKYGHNREGEDRREREKPCAACGYDVTMLRPSLKRLSRPRRINAIGSCAVSGTLLRC